MKMLFKFFTKWKSGSSWLWSYGSWIYNYLCNQCLSPLLPLKPAPFPPLTFPFPLNTPSFPLTLPISLNTPFSPWSNEGFICLFFDFGRTDVDVSTEEPKCLVCFCFDIIYMAIPFIVTPKYFALSACSSWCRCRV